MLTRLACVFEPTLSLEAITAMAGNCAAETVWRIATDHHMTHADLYSLYEAMRVRVNEESRDPDRERSRSPRGGSTSSSFQRTEQSQTSASAGSSFDATSGVVRLQFADAQQRQPRRQPRAWLLWLRQPSQSRRLVAQSGV